MMSLLSQKIQRLQRNMRAIVKRTKKLEVKINLLKIQKAEWMDRKKIEALKKALQ